MKEGDMERWREYFGKAGVDIWSIIQHAIRIAAMDDPAKFRHKREEIAETLFARELVEGVRHCGRDMETQAEADQGIEYAGIHHLICHHDEAEALTDELEEESLVLREINTIKETCIDADQMESIIFEALQRLKSMQITVQVLKATEIGKKVNGLRKHPSIRVRTLVKELVRHWKLLVNEWMVSAEEVTAAAITTCAGTECGDFPNQEEGLALPPLDEGTLLEARASHADLSKLFSFLDEDMGGQFTDRDAPGASFVEPFVKDSNLSHSCVSQSGSMFTDLSDFDAKASTNHPWGSRMLEERGGATWDLIEIHERQTVLRATSQDDDVPNCSGCPGRPACGMERTERTLSKWKTASNLASASRNKLVHKNVAMQVKDGSILPAMKSDKSQADQKLEITKRKLHQGYQEAYNARKQRIVQVLDISDLPKSAGKAVQARVSSPHVRGKSGAQRSQIGRHS